MKSNPREIFDIVDAHDRVIGRAERSEVHRRNLLHRAVHVLVFDKRGRLFVQKRSATKDTFPRCYDSSSSGHVGAGESYDACAERELMEELGLGRNEHRPLRRLFKIAACPETGWEFVWVFACRADGAIHLNREEIESGAWMSWEEAIRLIQRSPARCASGFVRILEELLLRGRRGLLAGL